MKASKAQFNRFIKSFMDMMKREKRYTWSLIVSFVLFLLTLVLPIWKLLPMASVNPFIPLHYNVLFGIDRFGPWFAIFWIPGLGFASLLTNTIVSTSVYHQEKFMATLLMIGSLFVQLTLLCAMTLIVLVNL